MKDIIPYIVPEFSDYYEDDRGVHFMSPLQSEFTICGDAFDVDAVDDALSQLKPTSKRTVTCPQCVKLIRALRGIRTK